MRHIPQRLRCGCLNPRAVIFRRRTRECLERQIGFDLAVHDDQEAVFGNRFAHNGEIQIPFIKDSLRLLFQFGF